MHILGRRFPQAAADNDTYFDLDEGERRRFWNRAAAHTWAGRERERHCGSTSPHEEHWYRSRSTPSNIIYYCAGRPGD
jgi:hypothetical protein